MIGFVPALPSSVLKPLTMAEIPRLSRTFPRSPIAYSFAEL
jgi:hypothetical protein